MTRRLFALWLVVTAAIFAAGQSFGQCGLLLGAGSCKTVTASAQVSVDAVGTHTASSAGTTFDYTGLTISGGLTHSALLLIVSVENTSISGLAINWDQAGTPQAMTQIGTVGPSGGAQMFMFGLVAPTSGNKTARLPWTGSATVTVAGLSFSGVNQTSVAAAFANFTTGSFGGTPYSIPVTAGANDIAIGAVQSLNTLGTFSGTTIYNDGLVFFFEGANYAPGPNPTLSEPNNITGTGLACAVVAG
jgi:hypothetical protein